MAGRMRTIPLPIPIVGLVVGWILTTHSIASGVKWISVQDLGAAWLLVQMAGGNPQCVNSDQPHGPTLPGQASADAYSDPLVRKGVVFS
jgi:hypothetical protein